MPGALSEVIKSLSNSRLNQKAYVPAIWLGLSHGSPKQVNYSSWIASQLQTIIQQKNDLKSMDSTTWTKRAVIYNMLVRFFAAYDHNADGQIGGQHGDITCNEQGIRETGSFLKAAALLPYLKTMGINTIHLLPITIIGQKGRKGDLGSPYAIRNPYVLDPLLADPASNVSIEIQFRAFVEAAHQLGMRVVQEFIFRTASIDADWIKEHPAWFYWLRSDVKNFYPPKFSDNELKLIKPVSKGKGMFIPPAATYQKLFTTPPSPNKATDKKIASAFADWPPDDIQPPWSDVTYLRMYNYDYAADNNYNYLAYNTIRYYDPVLAQEKHANHSLWKKLAQVIPFYQQHYGIDGAMIDMGHALPQALKEKIITCARKIDPNFAFWDENFDNKVATRSEGYDAVIGDAWYHIGRRNGFKKILRSADKSLPLPYFGTAETHNSPRFGIGNLQKKKAAWLLFQILPNAIPFLHNGYELDEKLPVNTGLNFSAAELQYLSRQPLALFYKTSLHWDLRSAMIAFLQKTAKIKHQNPWIFNKKGLISYRTGNPKVLGYRKETSKKAALILFNTNFYRKESFAVSSDISGSYKSLLDGGVDITLSNTHHLRAGQVVMLIRQS